MMFKAEINSDLLTEYIEAIRGVVDEGIINVTKGGWEIRAVDPANVAMVCCKLRSGIFNKFELEPKLPDSSIPVKIGIDFANLSTVLKRYQTQEIEFELDKAAENLFVRSETFEYSVPIIEPSSYRKGLKLPDMNYSVQAVIETEKFIQTIGAMEWVGDNITFNADGNMLHMRTEGERGDTLKSTLEGIFWTVEGAGNSNYSFSLEYISAFCKGSMRNAKQLTLSLEKEWPLHISFDIACGKVRYFLAPRISN